MASFAMASLMRTLELEFTQSSPRVSLDDENALRTLLSSLYFMLYFLYKKSESGAPIQDLETKLRDFALTAEDGIEIQISNILLAKDTESQDKARGKLLQTLQEVAEDAKELLKIIKNTSNEPEAASDTRPSIQWLKPASHPENVLSGGSSRCSPKLEDNVTEIRTILFRENDKRRVISIVGMPGLGKTALARRVYGDPLIASYFNIQAWIIVPQEYNGQQILCDLLQSMTPTVNKINQGSTLFEPREQLCRRLKGKRYLIVLDDVWNTRALDDILQCFPDESNGSCILLTTVFFRVARRVSFFFDIYKMSLLDSNESWDLFCNNLSHKEHMAPKFEEIGKHVVELCQGLPRSIIAVAERLSKCNYTLKEWKKIEKEVESLGTLYSDARHSSKLIQTYNTLPIHLKVSFLYFAVFPKGSEIQVKKLIRLWIDEGIVMPPRRVTFEDNAYWYLEELIDRSLVLISNRSFDGQIKTCRLHNSLHSFCIGEAQREGFFCAVNTQPYLGSSLRILANSCRWLSLRSHKLDYYVFFNSNNPRSLFLFHGDPEVSIPFKLLRILHLSPSPMLKRVPLHFGELVFLRYLSVSQWFEGLDNVVSTNPNLQTLIVSGIESKLGAPILHLPSRIWEAPLLRHLELGKMHTVDPPSMVKKHLQTLSWASTSYFREGEYYRFPNIKNLKIFYKDVFEPCCTRESCGNPIIILDNIEYLLQLEALTVLVPVGSITLLERPVFPAHLKTLRLSGTNLPVTVLRVISQLPKLKVLKLENAFYGRVWEPAEGGFLALKYLLLEARNLEQWVADASHFPELTRLGLRRCYCLEEVPRGLGVIRTLRIIDLKHCRPSVATSTKWIQQKRYDMNFLPIVVFVNGRRIPCRDL